jgi:hypothetical protein
MDDVEVARTKQLVWELVSPLLDRMDQLKHEIGELRRRVEECEAQMRAGGPAAGSPKALPAHPGDA